MSIEIIDPVEAPVKPVIEPEMVAVEEPDSVDAIREAEIIDEALDGIEEEDPIIEEE